MPPPPPITLDARLRRVTDLMDVGVLLLGGNKSLDFASRRAEELLGFPSVDTSSWNELMADLEESIDLAWTSRLNGKLVEVGWTRGEGSRSLLFQIYVLSEDECEGYLVVVRDPSMKQAIEADLASAAQLRNLHRLYLGLAHDLRSPLNSIVLNLELLKRSLSANGDDVEDARRARWIDLVETEAQRLSSSLDGLLAQTVEPEPERTRFDLGDLVSELARLLAGQSRQQGVEMSVQIGSKEVDDGPLLVEGYQDRLRRALLNVAINGLEATPEGGRLDLSVSADGLGWVAVRISDSGSGVPPENARKIFDLHFSTKDGSTGLGLYVARATFESDGGTLRLLGSQAGETTFLARLPRVDDPSLEPDDGAPLDSSS